MISFTVETHLDQDPDPKPATSGTDAETEAAAEDEYEDYNDRDRAPTVVMLRPKGRSNSVNSSTEVDGVLLKSKQSTRPSSVISSTEVDGPDEEQFKGFDSEEPRYVEPEEPIPANVAGSGFTQWQLAPLDEPGYGKLAMRKTMPNEVPEAVRNTRFNRHLDVLPNPDTAVQLDQVGSDVSSSYINANFVTGANGSSETNSKKYICAQGPLETTTESFYRMVLQYRVVSVVMMTSFEEKGKLKCFKYVPKPGKTAKFGAVQVTAQDPEVGSDYTITKLTVKMGGDSLEVTHFWFTNWKDHSVPKAKKALLTGPFVEFCELVRKHQASKQSSAPILSHCSAGVGRAGLHSRVGR